MKEPLNLVGKPSLLSCRYVVPRAWGSLKRRTTNCTNILTQQVRRNEPAAPKPNKGQQAEPKEPKEQSKGLLDDLMGKNGLGAIKGNSHHGLGLFPVCAAYPPTKNQPIELTSVQMRRDEKELETRQAPIQGSTLTSVLLEGGAVGKLGSLLSGGAKPKATPGASSPSKIGDGTAMGPPDPSSGAGPNSGPGLAAMQQQQQKSDAASQ